MTIFIKISIFQMELDQKYFTKFIHLLGIFRGIYFLEPLHLFLQNTSDSIRSRLLFFQFILENYEAVEEDF